MSRGHRASEKQQLLPLTGDEMSSGALVNEHPGSEKLMEVILERGNLQEALRRVCRNGGSPGVDGMSTKDLPTYLKSNWLRIRRELLSGSYQPKAVLRVEIPKATGGVRKLGIPTVSDRFIQQAVLQVLQRLLDRMFSDNSFGFRPERSCHQAIFRAQSYMESGNQIVVDLDLEKFFDRVCHEKLMSEVRKHVVDRLVLKLIHSYLKAGIFENGVVSSNEEGTPQGGPLSPLLSNVLLDQLDKELDKRGHQFVRYADDCNIYVKSRRSGDRVLRSVTVFLEKKLKLKVNRKKSAVDHPKKRKFLGFTLSKHGRVRRKISGEAITRFKARVRQLTGRTCGTSITKVVTGLNEYLRGWKGYFGICEVHSPLKELDSWVRRRLRAVLWKQWGRSGYKELRKRGVSRQLSWNTAKSAHGPWRLSRSPALAFALPYRYFKFLGLIFLYDYP